MQTISVWMQSESIHVHCGPTQDVDSDVCVVGGGIAGMISAYLLLKEGRTVIIVDDGPIGGGQTERTIVNSTNALDDRYPWTQLYDPARKPLLASDRFLKENLNAAAQYGSWVTGGAVESAQPIAPGTGAVVRQGLTKVAAYRDERGQLHERSAVCPYLGYVMRWNHNESTWDCPCHGSRFDKKGHLLCGPANTNLVQSNSLPDAFVEFKAVSV